MAFDYIRLLTFLIKVGPSLVPLPSPHPQLLGVQDKRTQALFLGRLDSEKGAFLTFYKLDSINKGSWCPSCLFSGASIDSDVS